MNILITGSTGHIGTYFYQKLVQDGFFTIASTRSESNYWRHNLLKLFSIKIVCIDLFAESEWIKYLRENDITCIIHLATYGSYSTQRNVEQTIKTNVFDSIIFLKACLSYGNIKLFISAGTGAEYSTMNERSKESDFLKPATIYGATKHAFNFLAQTIIPSDSKMKFYHLRLFTIYGPWEEPTRLIPKLLVNASEGKLPPLSNPLISKDYVYIEDLYQLILRLIDDCTNIPNGTYNVSSGKATSINRIVDIIIKNKNLLTQPVWGTFETRSFDSNKWTGNPDRAYQLTGWKAMTSIEDGLLLFDKWFKQTNILITYKNKINIYKY